MFQENKKNSTVMIWILTIILFLAVGALVYAFVLKSPQEVQEEPSQVPPVALKVDRAQKSEEGAPEDPTADWTTFDSNVYGFQIKYPKESNVTEESNINQNGMRIELPLNQTGTLLKGKYAEIRVVENQKECSPSSFPNPLTSETINGITWKKQVGSEGAAGTFSQFTNYSTPVDQNCLIVSFNLLVSNKYNYGSNPPPSFDEAEESKVFATMIASFQLSEAIKIAMVALDDQGKAGPKIGCGDSIVLVETGAPKRTQDIALKAALEELLAYREKDYGQSGLYNALYQSELEFDRIEKTSEEVKVFLVGKIVVNGVCDEPRVAKQLEFTANGYLDDTEQKLNFFINGKELPAVLSLE